MAQDWRAGTGRLDGKVMDAAGQPLAGATVKLELAGRGGTELRSDAKGRWAILGLTGGEWAVEVSADGYVSRRVTLSVSEAARRPDARGPTRQGQSSRRVARSRGRSRPG